MRVLLIGGSGGVGTSITPYLARHHQVRVLDLRPPKHADVDYVEGSITDPEHLERALHGCDSFINLVMQNPGPHGGTAVEQEIPMIKSQYAVNALGLHLLLFVAHRLGLRTGVHTSSMTVHDRSRQWYWQEEDVPYDSPGVYGLTKGFGEQICQYFARYFDMSLIALRITGPRSREAYLEERRARPDDFAGPLFVTDEEDLARAYLAALEATQLGHGRFDAFFIAGDEREVNHNLTKARRLLGWTPRSQELVNKTSGVGARTWPMTLGERRQ